MAAPARTQHYISALNRVEPSIVDEASIKRLFGRNAKKIIAFGRRAIVMLTKEGDVIKFTADNNNNNTEAESPFFVRSLGGIQFLAETSLPDVQRAIHAQNNFDAVALQLYDDVGLRAPTARLATPSATLGRVNAVIEQLANGTSSESHALEQLKSHDTSDQAARQSIVRECGRRVGSVLARMHALGFTHGELGPAAIVSDWTRDDAVVFITSFWRAMQTRDLAAAAHNGDALQLYDLGRALYEFYESMSTKPSNPQLAELGQHALVMAYFQCRELEDALSAAGSQSERAGRGFMLNARDGGTLRDIIDNAIESANDLHAVYASALAQYTLSITSV